MRSRSTPGCAPGPGRRALPCVNRPSGTAPTRSRPMSPAPYADLVPVHHTLPDHGLPRDEVLGILRSMASQEDATWESGRCSGTMYCGDHDHYDFLNQAFALFSHVNVLQRDMCPSATRFESEIIAMTLDLLHGEAVDGDGAGGPRLVGRHGEHLPRRARLPRPRLGHPRRGASQRDQARDGPPGLRQGVPPVRRRAPDRPGRPGDDPGRHRLGGRRHRRPTHRPRRLGLQLRLRDRRPDQRPVRDRPRARDRPARGRLPRRVDPALRPGARLRHPASSTSACRG